jgi:hypothetical protein
MKLAFLAPLVLTGGLALSGCNTISNLYTIASGSASPSQVYVAANAFDAVEGTATQYLRLPLCPQSQPVCRTKTTSQVVYNNVKTARAARNALEAYMTANPGAPVPVSNYNILVTALQTLNALVAANAPIPVPTNTGG